MPGSSTWCQFLWTIFPNPQGISSKKKINAFNDHLKTLLEKKNFFKPDEKKRSMLMNINNLIYRLEPSDKELRILASIMSTLTKNKVKP